MKEMPTFDLLMNPLLKALSELGGSGSIDEIYEKVAELEEIDEEILSVSHNPEKSNQTEVAYRLAWARTYLKKYGFLENSSRGIWTLTQKAKEDPNPQLETRRCLKRAGILRVSLITGRRCRHDREI